ncbi:MAG: PEGA domain-containing protein [Planctomycetota bacterium]|nr:PEGA domain-containing protein [Planctomycetota bacterium]
MNGSGRGGGSVAGGDAPPGAVLAASVLAFVLAILAGHLAGRAYFSRHSSLLVGPTGLALPSRSPVEITSEPAGATVYVDGMIAGRTPLILDDPAGGDLRAVRVEKAGFLPAARRVDLSRGGPVPFRLQPGPGGSISISTAVPGAEVLLDGEMAGFTPLTISNVAAGSHQIILRKTNFDSAVIPAIVRAGETTEIEGVEMRDRILAMLEGLTRAEPHRIGHLIDLAHYHFVNGRLDDSVDCFVRALRMSEEPLKFPPEMELGEEDKAFEMRLRAEDVNRLKSEINKHKSWPGRNTQRFREKLDAAMHLHATRNIGDWTWVQQALQPLRERKDYQRAEELLREHLKANPASEQGCIALVEIGMERGSFAAAEAAFEKAFGALASNPSALRQLGNSVFRFRARLAGEDRDRVLAWSEKAFRRGIETARDKNLRAQLLFELSLALHAGKRTSEALTAIREAVSSTATPEAAEMWKLTMSDYLVTLGMIPEARDTLEELVRKAKQESIRTSAQQRLQRLEDPEKKKTGP